MAALDRWGRYLVPPEDGGKPVPHTRATTLAATLDDRYGLERWGRRTLAQGLAKRSDLLTAVAACRDAERDRLDELCDQALEAGGSSTSATLGSALHKFTERVDLGELDVSAIGEAWRDDVGAYVKALADAGFVVERVEEICVVPSLTVAGTLDRIVSRDGCRFILDVKTGQRLDYSWPSIAVQLACYAHAETIYNDEDKKHSPMPEVSQTLGLVAHVPAGAGRCELIGVDLAAGWQGAQIAHRVRQFRKEQFRIAPEDPTSVRRAWLVAQVRRLVDEYPEAARDLAGLWPAGVPTLKTEHTHSADELEQIAQMVQKVEAVHRVPFGGRGSAPSTEQHNGKKGSQMTINWTQFKGEYVKWADAGQVVTGVVRAVRVGSYKDKQYPELVLDTEDGTRVLSASQAGLMRQLADDPPAIGDTIRVEYKGEGEAKAGQSPIKLFAVDVTHLGASVPTTAAPAASDLV